MLPTYLKGHDPRRFVCHFYQSLKLVKTIQALNKNDFTYSYIKSWFKKLNKYCFLYYIQTYQNQRTKKIRIIIQLAVEDDLNTIQYFISTERCSLRSLFPNHLKSALLNLTFTIPSGRNQIFKTVDGGKKSYKLNQKAKMAQKWEIL